MATVDDGRVLRWSATDPDRDHAVTHGAIRDGRAMRFDGRGDYVDLGNAAALRLTGDMTVSAWVRLNARAFPDPTTNWTIVDCEQHRRSGFILRLNGTDGRVMFRVNQRDADQVGWSDASLQNGQAGHIVVTKRGNEGCIYVNGMPAPTFEVSDPAPGDRPLTISNAPQSFAGTIFEVSIYRRALDRREIGSRFHQEREEYGVEVDPWTLPIADNVLASWGSLSGGERLSVPPAGWTVTSSNADFAGFYSNSAIDGDPNTAWRSFQPATEEWIDLAWDFPTKVDRVCVLPHESNALKRVELFAWHRDRWASLATHTDDGQPFALTFDTVRSRRLRLVMKGETRGTAGLREIGAFGPKQPMLTIHSDDRRWQYVHARPTSRPVTPTKVAIELCEITPSNPAPGSDVRLRLRLRPLDEWSAETALVVTLGEREMDFKRSDYTVTREILEPHMEGDGSITVDQPIYLPIHAPHGSTDVMLHSAPQAAMQLVDVDDGRIGRIDTRRFARDPEPDGRAHDIRLDSTNGAIITIDGKPTPPILFAMQCPSVERFHSYTQVGGVKLYHVQIYPYRIDDGDYQTHNYAFVAGHVRTMLRVDPEAYAIIQMDMRTSADWREANPGSSLIAHDGTEAHESFCAKQYRDEAIDYVAGLVRFVEKQPWRNRVIGYLVELGEPEGVLSGYQYGIGDYSPQAIEAFRDFLRGKYRDQDHLRKAYGDPSLTFGQVYPTYSQIVARGHKGGCFLHPVKQRLAIDYHAFLSSLVPSFLTDHLAATIKRLTGGRVLVGSYWGYMTHDLTFGEKSHQLNHCYLPQVLESPNVDFFASPFSYSYPARHAGEPPRVFQTVGALRINGKLQIPECDHRTFRAGVTINGRNWSREDSLALIRRDIGGALMHGSGAWFSDWTNNDRNDRRLSEPFFLDEQLLREIAALRSAYAKSLDEPRKEVAETAVLVSGPSHFHHDGNAGPIYNELVRKMLYTQIGKIGAPLHELVLEDLTKPRVQNDYKCYIFLNAFYLTPGQWTVVESLKRDGKTLVWFYAPGYTTDTELSTDHIASLTGFKTGVELEPQALTYQTRRSTHPLLRGVEPGEYGGTMGEVSPRFFVTDERADVLGRYADGRAAFVARDFGSHKSVYCTSTFMTTAILRNLLRYAGCHIYVEDDIYMDATRDVMMLTNTFEKERQVRVALPRTCDVVTLVDEAPVASGVKAFDVFLPRGCTLLYRLR